MHSTSPQVNSKPETDHYFKTRNFDLAEKVASLPDAALVGAYEISALCGIAATSIMKPSQRLSIGLPEPRVLGRMNKWTMGTVRSWLQLGQQQSSHFSQATSAPGQEKRGRGRPHKTMSVVESQTAHA